MKIGKIYDKLAESYDYRQNNPTTKIIRKKEITLLKRFAFGRMVDIGCGTGYHMKYIKNCIGIDISKKMLKIAKVKNTNIFLIGNSSFLPFKDASFNTIIMMFATLNLCDLEKSIREMGRVLKSDGIVILSVASIFDNGYSFFEKLRKDKPKERLIGIQKHKIKMKLFERGEIINAFEKIGFKLEYFNSLFIFFKPRWGDFTPLSKKERLSLFLEKIFPIKKYGCMYFFVFKKIFQKEHQ